MRQNKKEMQDLEIISISSGKWRHEDLELEQSRALVGGNRYVRIRVNVDDLFKLFELPPATNTVTMDEIAGIWIYRDRDMINNDAEDELQQIKSPGAKRKYDLEKLLEFCLIVARSKRRQGLQKVAVNKVRDLYKIECGLEPSYGTVRSILVAVWKALGIPE
jgi:hypothetical protein